MACTLRRYGVTDSGQKQPQKKKTRPSTKHHRHPHIGLMSPLLFSNLFRYIVIVPNIFKLRCVYP
ncbi:MAG: hypothetical protein P8X79_04970 [Reinekea sp.]